MGLLSASLSHRLDEALNYAIVPEQQQLLALLSREAHAGRHYRNLAHLPPDIRGLVLAMEARMEPRLGDGDPQADFASTAPRSWGLDVSTTPQKTAAVAIQWNVDQARIVEIAYPLRADQVVDLIYAHRHEPFAIDVPFGWPEQFVALMTDRQARPLRDDQVPADTDWEQWRTRTVAQRRTDRFIVEQPEIGTRPLAVPFQLLGATAAMWCLIEARLAERGIPIDRSGMSGLICETYPRAALAGWGHREPGKTDWWTLQRLFPFLTARTGLADLLTLEDVCDAVVCALVARARTLRLTIPPRIEDQALAQREGWIHVAAGSPTSALLASEPPYLR